MDEPGALLTVYVSAEVLGTINGIDGGTNSILTKNIPKNTERLFFRVTFYFACLSDKFDRCTSLVF